MKRLLFVLFSTFFCISVYSLELNYDFEPPYFPWLTDYDTVFRSDYLTPVNITSNKDYIKCKNPDLTLSGEKVSSITYSFNNGILYKFSLDLSIASLVYMPS